MKCRRFALTRWVLSVIVLGLAACTGLPPGIEPVQFDAQRYTGEWFEIMRLDHSFERGLTNVRASYTLKPDGRVEVINKGFDPKECRWRDATGSASFQSASHVASLSVTFFPPFAGGYHVFALDRNYQWALVAGPTRDYLWILARKPVLAPDLRARLVKEAQAKGFPVEQLILVDQSTPRCTPLR